MRGSGYRPGHRHGQDRAIASISDLGTILGVWAHPDDETYLSGGLMLQAVTGGQRVVCVTATAGEVGSDDPAWPPERLGPHRRAELEKALGLLGVVEHHWLDYPDGGCAEVAEGEAVGRVAALVDAVRPDTVLTFGPDGFTGHSDHRTVGRWAAAAVRRAAPDARLLAAARTPEWIERFADLHRRVPVFDAGLPRPLATEEVVVDLRLVDDVLEQKVAALLAQESQTEPVIAAVGAQLWRRWLDTETFGTRPG